MLLETAPGLGEAQEGLPPTATEDGSANKDGGPQGGRFSVTAGFGDLSLVKRQQVVGKEHGQEGGLGGEKGLGAKAVGVEVVFDFLDALLHGGSRVVIAPDLHSVLGPVGDPNTERVTGHIDEFAPHGRLFLAHAFAHDHKAAVLVPAGEPGMEAGRRIGSAIEFLPVADPVEAAVDFRRQPGHDDVGDGPLFQEAEQRLVKEPAVGSPSGCRFLSICWSSRLLGTV